ncbi:hypothetical protein JKA73_24445 [Myxococcus xanthus]|uniref:hypothetical protein n=1 Tax=Myxococcus xanthus TaxID=34 RepID=UPI0019176ED7|nr:hypothetical protein [Myxococcus xanthus]QQR42262.1 hypothetical protein JKA73_24445 [Myxococcus xanthus]
MIENLSYIRTSPLLARPEPPSGLIPIPVFRPAVSVVEDGDEPEPVESAILKVLVDILRAVRALHAREGTQNVSAVPLERAEAMLGCKRSQVFNLLEQGRLERAPKVGRSVMITVASIEALLAENVPRKGNARARSKSRRSRAIKAAPVAAAPAPDARELGAAILKLPI